MHLGSLAAALAGWLDARANGGHWLVRMEDLDEARCDRAAGLAILASLARFGLVPDEPVIWQSERKLHYRAALDRLIADGLAYPCACTRAELALAPCPCRNLHRQPRSWRFRSPNAADDAILLRADGYFAYQLAVVVDDHLQNITHVVRGDDLRDATPGQIALQQALGYATPAYHHIPVVRDTNGDKLSKQTRAAAIDEMPTELALGHAFFHLGMPPLEITPRWPAWAVPAWRSRRA